MSLGLPAMTIQRTDHVVVDDIDAAVSHMHGPTQAPRGNRALDKEK